jgi:hypothetical protein
MRTFLALPLLLAACHAPSAPPAANVVDQPNESVVEQDMENGQDAVDDQIINDAATDPANADNLSLDDD